jgi:SAM-dependent methyltransferase
MDRLAETRDHWIDVNRFFHEADYAYLRFLVPEGTRVLDLGCGTGRLLAALKPSRGIGIDISPRMVDVARRKHADLEFTVGDVEDPDFLGTLQGPFDAIVLSDTLGYLDDCVSALGALQPLCGPDTRIIITYYSHLWEPILRLGQKAGMRMPSGGLSWLSMSDIGGMLHLAGFEVVKHEWRQLLPRRFLGLGTLVNRFVAPLPFIRRLCLRHYVVARSLQPSRPANPSCSVLIPCRNERGNIEAAVRRLPRLCEDLELIFVEGHSQDGTWEEILRVKDVYPQLDIKAMRQTGEGKGNAVREALAVARGELLMILDADLTVAPEDLPTFYRVLASGKAEFVNGTRFVYPMEDQSMRLLNYWANRTFAIIFSYLLNERFTDTLCGTKAMMRTAHDKIAEHRSYFGDFDPFGDFDLIFGAAKQNLKIADVPVRYASRTYGSTQISRFRHGWLLLRMVLFALRKLKMI